MFNVIDAATLLVLVCLLAATMRITLHRSFDRQHSLLMHMVAHPIWCIGLIHFVPMVIAGYAVGELSYLPWEVFEAHRVNGLPDAITYTLCVVVVDLWMFVTPGQFAIMLVNRNTVLSEPEKSSERLFYIVANLFAGFLIVMQAQNVYQIFQHVNVTTAYFMAAIVLLGIYFHSNFTPFVVAKAPAILTTCGILGTFVGVAIGLMDFNPAAIQQSVLALVDGIKTAFWASACGIFFALTIKLREVFFGASVSNKTQPRATVDDLATLMASVHQSLAGKAETSLHGQMTLARQDNNERLEALTTLMEAFVKQQRPMQFKGSADTRVIHTKLTLATQN